MLIDSATFCPLCERLCAVTRGGLLWQHKAWRVGKNGKPYRTSDICPAGGMTPQEAAR